MIREDAVFKMTENAQLASGDQEAAVGSKGKENWGSVHLCGFTWLYTSRTERPVQHQDKSLVQTAGTEQRNKAVQMQF